MAAPHGALPWSCLGAMLHPPLPVKPHTAWAPTLRIQIQSPSKVPGMISTAEMCLGDISGHCLVHPRPRLASGAAKKELCVPCRSRAEYRGWHGVSSSALDGTQSSPKHFPITIYYTSTSASEWWRAIRDHYLRLAFLCGKCNAHLSCHHGDTQVLHLFTDFI